MVADEVYSACFFVLVSAGACVEGSVSHFWGGHCHAFGFFLFFTRCPICSSSPIFYKAAISAPDLSARSHLPFIICLRFNSIQCPDCCQIIGPTFQNAGVFLLALVTVTAAHSPPFRLFHTPAGNHHGTPYHCPNNGPPRPIVREKWATIRTGI